MSHGFKMVTKGVSWIAILIWEKENGTRLNGCPIGSNKSRWVEMNGLRIWDGDKRSFLDGYLS